MEQHGMPSGRGEDFLEPHTPPWWYRLLAYGLPLAWVGFGWLRGGPDAAAGAAVGGLIWALCLGVVVDVSLWRYGGVRVEGGRIAVGHRSAPLAGLDLATLRRASAYEVFAAFDRYVYASNPLWLRDSVSLRAVDDTGAPIRIAVGTNRREELVAALREGHRDAAG